MKQKIFAALCALSLLTLLASCDMGTENTSSLNNTSSVMSGNIPENNTDGEYDNSSNNSSGSIGSEINSMVSSDAGAINSALK